MLKYLAILAVLVMLVVASVGFLEGQSTPLSSPKERVAQTDSGQNTKEQPETDQHKNAPINLTSADVEMVSTPCDEACQQGRRNLEIQGKVEWFTGLLAIVGVLQVGTMIWQAILLSQTRGDVHRQAEWMETQAGHMECQTKIQGDSVAAAQKSADAADISAKAAMGVAVPTLMLSKFTFVADDCDDMGDFYRLPRVKIEVKNFGQSPAFLKSYTVSFTWKEVLKDEPLYQFPYPCNIEDVVAPGDTFVLGEEATTPDTYSSEEEISEYLKFNRSLKVYGYVCYGNIFGPDFKYLLFCKRLIDFNMANGEAIMEDYGYPKYTDQKTHYDGPYYKISERLKPN